MLRRLLLAALMLTGPTMASAGAGQEAAFTLRYDVTILGLPIGSAALDVRLAGKAYDASISARVGGLAALVSDGHGEATASGRLGDKAPLAAGFRLDSISEDERTTIRMDMRNGTVTAVALEPPVQKRRDRVPLTDSDRKGVVDPVSAMLMPVPGSGDPLSASACDRNLPVFDGAQRFDVTLAFSRFEDVDAAGYGGKALVCSVRYTPIAGHRANRKQTKALAANRDMEIWLVPVPGTRLLAPWRIEIATQFGMLTINAAKVMTTALADLP